MEALKLALKKVAIYADQRGIPTHMARQLENGMWTSKCGELEDIEHETLEALQGFLYGSPIQFLSKPI